MNSTAQYTFLEIKLGPLDYTTPLLPGQGISYVSIDPGSYSLFTKGIEGTWYEWPVPQVVERGYSYTLIFTIKNGRVEYHIFVAMVP